jgi:hypothetical protein
MRHLMFISSDSEVTVRHHKYPNTTCFRLRFLGLFFRRVDSGDHDDDDDKYP